MAKRQLLSISECAERRNCARSTIHAAIQRGDLAAEKVGRQWVISATACAAFTPLKDPAEIGRRGGRPRKAATDAPQPKRPRGRPRKGAAEG